MDATASTVVRYTGAAAISALAGGLLVFAVVGPGKEELARVGAERDSLKSQVGALKGRVGPLEADVQALRRENADLVTEAGKLRATLAEADKALAEARTAREAVTRQLGKISEKAAASATEQEATARKAAASAEGLEQAKAHAATLNKAYEALLKEQKQLAATDATRREELERTKKALEEAQAEVARLTGARGIYTVQAGDYLSKVAEFFYHDGQRWPDIFRANGFLISHPDLIYPRMVLIIPH